MIAVGATAGIAGIAGAYDPSEGQYHSRNSKCHWPYGINNAANNNDGNANFHSAPYNYAYDGCL
jgi:hypothetical protein